jgi:hypothetical protein
MIASEWPLLRICCVADPPSQKKKKKIFFYIPFLSEKKTIHPKKVGVGTLGFVIVSYRCAHFTPTPHTGKGTQTCLTVVYESSHTVTGESAEVVDG